MKQGLTEIVAILDKSGSMRDVAKDALGGINTFIDGQKAEPGDANFTLTLFDTKITKAYNGINIKDVAEFKDYRPDGNTALLDAIGITIDEVGSRLAELTEENRPEKVIVAILTDGEENSSKLFTREQILEKINHQRDAYKWEFIFLAANQDAIQAGESIGVMNSFAYDSTADGTRDAYSSINLKVASFRKTGKV